MPAKLDPTLMKATPRPRQPQQEVSANSTEKSEKRKTKRSLMPTLQINGK